MTFGYGVVFHPDPDKRVTVERQEFANGSVQNGVVIHPDGNIEVQSAEEGTGGYIVPCNRKVHYGSEEAAKQALTNMLRRLGHSQTTLGAYQCPYDRSHWHLGNVSEKAAERAAAAAGKK